MSTQPGESTAKRPWRPTYVLFVAMLWVAFISLHQSENSVRATIPTWLHLILWCGLLGAAIGGLSGRIVKGALIGTLVLPVLIFLLFIFAFIGG